MTFRTWRSAFVGAFFVALAGTAHEAMGQSVLNLMPHEGQFRGVAIDVPRGRLYAAVYDRAEIAVIDLPSGELVQSVAAGEGPSALAIAEGGGLLACANRLDSTLTIVSLDSLQPVRTVEVGSAPTSVVALPGGGFASANAFADSVTIVDASSQEAHVTIAPVASVPIAVAATSEYLGVVTRQPSQLHVYSAGADEPITSIRLPGVPSAIVAVAMDRFAIATKSALAIVSVSEGVLHTVDGGFVDVAVRGDSVLALTNDSVIEYDDTLHAQTSYNIPHPPWAFAVSEETTVVTFPAEKVIGVMSDFERTTNASAPEPTPAPTREPPAESEPLPPEPIAPEPSASETGSADESRIVFAASEPPTVEPAPEFTAEPLQPPPESAPLALAQARAAPDATATEEKSETRETRAERRASRRERLRAMRPAPDIIGGNTPHAPILGRATGEAFMKSLEEGLVFGVGGGTTDLPWENDITDLDARALDADLETEGKIVAEGNAQFDLGDAHIEAERIVLDQPAGEVLLEDSVSIRRDSSQLTADKLLIRLRDDAVRAETEIERPPPPLVPSRIEEEAAGESLRAGSFEADNIDLNEPDRALTADYLLYDLSGQTGEILAADGRAGPVYFNAKSLRILGPDEVTGEDLWVTTCDRPVPHYRIRIKNAEMHRGEVIVGTNARLQVGNVTTPLYVPRWRFFRGPTERRTTMDFDIGHRADIGHFLNVAQWFALSRNFELGLRFYPTSQEGVGAGVDARWDYMNASASPLFRSRGELQTLYTTEDRGYIQFYNRQEFTPRTVALTQWEQWFDRDFVKDFYNEEYENRTGPRSFFNVTHTWETQILAGTVSKSTHDFTTETEKLPEITYHLLERRIADDLYFTFDSVGGYYDRVQHGSAGTRLLKVARLSYDIEVNEGVNFLPFIETEAAWYSKTLDGEDDTRFSGTFGVTTQARVHKTYPGRFGFSAFKHIVVPSITVFHRETGALDAEDTPRFDALDDRPGRTRVESKIDNVILGRNAANGEVWRVARITLYQGNDIDNEFSESNDYEVHFEVRPRPTWGFQTIAEHHSIEESIGNLDGDLNRVLAYLFYDDYMLDNRWNGRLGFVYTESEDVTINEEILYGFGYRFSDAWSFGFEHRYDTERDTLSRQTYELRRRLHKWELGLRLRERESGLSFGFEFTLLDFPGTRLRI